MFTTSAIDPKRGPIEKFATKEHQQLKGQRMRILSLFSAHFRDDSGSFAIASRPGRGALQLDLHLLMQNA